jgi:hypothetical protein
MLKRSKRTSEKEVRERFAELLTVACPGWELFEKEFVITWMCDAYAKGRRQAFRECRNRELRRASRDIFRR